MAFEKVNLALLAIAIIGGLIAFVIVFHTCYEKRAPDASADDEPPLSPDHEVTVHIGDNIPPEERERLSKQRNESPETVPFGQVDWKTNKTGKADPQAGLSSHDKDEQVIKPDTKDGSAVR